MNGGHNLHFDSAYTPGLVVAAISILEAKQGSEQLLIEELDKLMRNNRQPTGSNPFGPYESIFDQGANRAHPSLARWRSARSGRPNRRSGPILQG